MGSPDNYHEIASLLLRTDAELGLTFARLGFSYPEGARRRTAIGRAEEAYQKICELKGLVLMTAAAREELREKLDKLRAALEEANQSAHVAPSGS